MTRPQPNRRSPKCDHKSICDTNAIRPNSHSISLPSRDHIHETLATLRPCKSIAWFRWPPSYGAFATVSSGTRLANLLFGPIHPIVQRQWRWKGGYCKVTGIEHIYPRTKPPILEVTPVRFVWNTNSSMWTPRVYLLFKYKYSPVFVLVRDRLNPFYLQEGNYVWNILSSWL
jgi:hypothetical protein